MSALMIATITIKDPEKFQQYLTGNKEIAARYGAELLARGTVDKILTGEDKDHALTVIAKFPSLEKIDEWYGSDEYQPLVPIRKEGSEMKITTYEILD